jgi:hypothetical protein
MKVQVLSTPGCENGVTTLALVRELAAQLPCALGVEQVFVDTEVDARQHAFPGSPTVRVNGVDIDPDPPRGIGLG